MKFLVESLQRLNQKPKPPQRLLKVNPLRNRNNYFRIRVNLFRKRVNNVRLLRNDIRKRVNLFQYKAKHRTKATFCIKSALSLQQVCNRSIRRHENRLEYMLFYNRAESNEGVPSRHALLKGKLLGIGECIQSKHKSEIMRLLLT